jgi:hypothetical protein
MTNCSPPTSACRSMHVACRNEVGRHTSPGTDVVQVIGKPAASNKHSFHPTDAPESVPQSHWMFPVPALLMQPAAPACHRRIRERIPLPLFWMTGLLSKPFGHRFSLTFIANSYLIAEAFNHRIPVRNGRLQLGGWAHAAAFQLANGAAVQRRDRLQAAAPPGHGILAQVGHCADLAIPCLSCFCLKPAVSHHDCAISSTRSSSSGDPHIPQQLFSVGKSVFAVAGSKDS